jgi:hypothetical protein
MSLAIVFSCHPVDRMLLTSSTAAPAGLPMHDSPARQNARRLPTGGGTFLTRFSNGANAGREYGPSRNAGFCRRMNFAGTPGRAGGPACRSLHSFLGRRVAFMVILSSLAILPGGSRSGRCISPDWQSFGFPYAAAVELQLPENQLFEKHLPSIDFRIPFNTGPRVCVGSRSAHPRDDSRRALSDPRLRAEPGVVSRPIAVWSAG